MTTVYKYDPKNRRPIGAHECRVDPKTGDPMRPRHSLDVAPPEFPAEFVVVTAGVSDWFVDLEASRASALAEIDKTHADLLRRLTGSATIEERDTWAPKAQAARSLLAGTADGPQASMLGLEAKQRGVSVKKFAGEILARAAGFEQLIGVSSAIRTKARAAFKAAETIEEMLAVGHAISIEVEAAVVQITGVQTNA